MKLNPLSVRLQTTWGGGGGGVGKFQWIMSNLKNCYNYVTSGQLSLTFAFILKVIGSVCKSQRLTYSYHPFHQWKVLYMA